jgi:hypothetical protein
MWERRHLADFRNEGEEMAMHCDAYYSRIYSSVTPACFTMSFMLR